MLTSEPCTDLLSALLAARLAFPPITRNCEAWSPKSKKTYPYADQNAIIDATVPVLGAHGILLIQAPEDGEPGLMCVTTTLFHTASGQWMRSTISFERLSNPQDAGSQITYYKRYGLAAILSLSTETDDDAISLNGAHKPEPAAAAEKPRPSVPVNGNGHTPAPEPDAGLEHPTLQHLDALRKLAVETCQDEVETYENRLRRAMGVPLHASVSPRLLTKSMSMQAYMEVYGWYVNLEAQLEKSRKEAPSGPEPASEKSSDPVSAAASTGEEPPVDPQPAASGSAGQDSADVAERERIVREAMDFGISEAEAWYCVKHHSLKDAEQLLLAAAKKRTKAA